LVLEGKNKGCGERNLIVSVGGGGGGGVFGLVILIFISKLIMVESVVFETVRAGFDLLYSFIMESNVCFCFSRLFLWS